MATVWERVKALEGKTLYTEPQKKPFAIKNVTRDRVEWVPVEGKGTTRWWPRTHIEDMVEVRAEKGSLTPQDIRDRWPNDQNTSYVPVIVNTIYEP